MAIWIDGYNRAKAVRTRWPVQGFRVGWLALALGACATTKEGVIPPGGPDMATVYATHQRQAGIAADPAQLRHHLTRPIQSDAADLYAYTRDAAREIDPLFPVLPNPQLVLYVFPHLSAEGAPVPGYTTAFPMYPVDQYALPGEVYQP